jgi:hypothetical protein
MWLTVSDNIMTQHHGFPNDDIVTTLRTMVQFTNAVAGGVCWRAADEIERLRAEVARLGAFLHPVGMVINTEHGAVIPKAGIEGVTDEEVNEYLKAVRGE